MQSNSELVLWTLRLHEINRVKIEVVMDEYRTVEAKAQETELEKLGLNEEVIQLKKQLLLMELDRPINYIETKKKIHQFVRNLKSQASERGKLLKQWSSRFRKRRKIESYGDEI